MRRDEAVLFGLARAVRLALECTSGVDESAFLLDLYTPSTARGGSQSAAGT
jgi:hypothetical protein